MNFFGKRGHQWFGFLYGDGKYQGQTEDPRIFCPPAHRPTIGPPSALSVRP
jgi:hypothetical protein